MRTLLNGLYILCALVLFVIPLLQVGLHRKLTRSGEHVSSELGRRNHLLFLLAVASASGVYYFVNPEANIRVDLLLAIPLCGLALLFWTVFLIRLARARR
jgi:hypothetical protein